jgi:hypothetical protein
MLFQQAHIEISSRFDPILVHSYCQGPDQPKAACFVGEDPDHVSAPLDLLVQPFEHVRRFHVLVMLSWQRIEREYLLNVPFDPVAKLWVTSP